MEHDEEQLNLKTYPSEQVIKKSEFYEQFTVLHIHYIYTKYIHKIVN